MSGTSYTPAQIEEKWQKIWDNNNAFKAETDPSKPKHYVLEMLPYPSGVLHVGHTRNYTIGDIRARFMRAKGFNVLHPMGWDAFGLPAENAALKNKAHPKEWTLKNIEAMKTVLQRFGYTYDWDREVATCLPNYYGQQQKLFLSLYKKGLAYQKESLVNWDPVDQTVLANEQVVDGKGWRSGAPVERRSMRQWFFKITDYAEELLADVQKLEGWPERVRIMQENWIGRSTGVQFHFVVEGVDVPALQKLAVYTTRPDTIFGATFCCVAPEHPLAAHAAANSAEARSFVEECQSMGTSEEAIEKAEKKGWQTPYTAVHPFTGEKLPVYIANFVLMGYGTGAIMAVPAHDARDNAFAKKYGIATPTVVRDEKTGEAPDLSEPMAAHHKLENSDFLNGMSAPEAKEAVTEKFAAMGIGEQKVNWRLRDWGMSRQRYWGCPIPVVHCEACGTVPVPEDQLPLELPEDVDFDKPGSPIARHPSWKHTTCPSCGGKAERETDTMDTFVDSSWYFTRYTCPHADEPIAKADSDYWQPVDQYIGGIEHAVLHLLYARFLSKALRDCGYAMPDEPFTNLFCQGMINGPSFQATSGDYINPIDVRMEGEKAFHKQTGEELKIDRSEKLSKSKNNAAPLDNLIEQYGVDTLRTFAVFAGPVDKSMDWTESGVDGIWRFFNRLWALAEKVEADATVTPPAFEELSRKEAQALKRKIHQTICKVTADIEGYRYNTMVAAVMELSNMLGAFTPENAAEHALFREGVLSAVHLLNPVAPHISEELWSQLGETQPLFQKPWLDFDAEAAKDDEVTLVVQVNGKLKARLTVPADIDNESAQQQALAAIEGQIDGLAIRKCIVVPGRLVNVVAG